MSAGVGRTDLRSTHIPDEVDAEHELDLYRRMQTDTSLRGTRLSRVSAGRAPGNAAPEPGSGGGRGRRLRRAASDRLDHLHPSTPRSRARQGRRCPGSDGRALRQSDRLLRRQGRLDASRRPVGWDAPGDRDRRRRQHGGDRSRAGVQADAHRPGGRVLLRRWRDQRRRVSRGAELRGGPASPDRLRV